MKVVLAILLGALLLFVTACQRKDVKWLREGTREGKAGAYDNALHAFEMAIQENPQSAQAWQGKGYTLELMGKPAEAMAAFDTAIALNAEYPQPWLSKGMLYLKQDRAEDANMAFTRALQLQPDWDQAHYERGLALTDLFRYDDAIAEFTQAAALSPSLGAIYYGRAKAYLARSDTARFWSDLKSAVSLDTATTAKALQDSTLAAVRQNAQFERIIRK